MIEGEAAQKGIETFREEQVDGGVDLFLSFFRS